MFSRRLEWTICLDKQDATALWNELRERVSLVKGGKLSAGQGSFGHIVGGYDAGYYGWASKSCVSSSTDSGRTDTRTR
jgi:Zn-dependent oligopeptidase